MISTSLYSTTNFLERWRIQFFYLDLLFINHCYCNQLKIGATIQKESKNLANVRFSRMGVYK